MHWKEHFGFVQHRLQDHRARQNFHRHCRNERVQSEEMILEKDVKNLVEFSPQRIIFTGETMSGTFVSATTIYIIIDVNKK